MMNSSLSRQLITFSVFMVSLIAVTPASFGAEKAPANGMKCTAPHPGTVHPCTPNNPDPAKATAWSIMTDGAFKTCEQSGNPRDNCEESMKNTHKIELFSDAACSVPTINFDVDESRCD